MLVSFVCFLIVHIISKFVLPTEWNEKPTMFMFFQQ